MQRHAHADTEVRRREHDAEHRTRHAATSNDDELRTDICTNVLQRVALA